MKLVVSGARLNCSMGSASSTLSQLKIYHFDAETP